MPKICLDFQVYTYQIDFLGHVNNAVYLHWMEIGRTRLLEAVGLPIHEIADRGFVPVVVHTSIHYKTPLYISDAVHLELWIAELKHASALMNFHFRNGDQRVVVEAQQKGLFIDRDSQRPRRLPAEERQLFSHYTLP